VISTKAALFADVEQCPEDNLESPGLLRRARRRNELVLLRIAEYIGETQRVSRIKSQADDVRESVFHATPEKDSEVNS
jgi:hypothetical protein